MQIILLDKVVNLGGLGDVVKVKDGYARNYLIPQGKAKRANAANLAEFEARRAELERLAAEQLAAAQALQEVNVLASDSRRSLGPQSEVQYEMLRALQELSQAGKALQRTAEGLDQQPQSLIFGKQR